MQRTLESKADTDSPDPDDLGRELPELPDLNSVWYGNDTKLDADTVRVVTRMLRRGHTKTSAAQAIGVSRQTFYNWVNHGKRNLDSSEEMNGYGAFYICVAQAELQSKDLYVQTLRSAAIEGDTDAAKWMLERQNPDEYSKEETIVSAVDESDIEEDEELSIEDKQFLSNMFGENSEDVEDVEESERNSNLDLSK
jgi:hypothetical protein